MRIHTDLGTHSQTQTQIELKLLTEMHTAKSIACRLRLSAAHIHMNNLFKNSLLNRSTHRYYDIPWLPTATVLSLGKFETKIC